MEFELNRARGGDAQQPNNLHRNNCGHKGISNAQGCRRGGDGSDHNCGMTASGNGRHAQPTLPVCSQAQERLALRCERRHATSVRNLQYTLDTHVSQAGAIMQTQSRALYRPSHQRCACCQGRARGGTMPLLARLRGWAWEQSWWRS